jgi:hypothetical protein
MAFPQRRKEYNKDAKQNTSRFCATFAPLRETNSDTKSFAEKSRFPTFAVQISQKNYRRKLSAIRKHNLLNCITEN